jgi:Spy/CpxP family protein refolding chaperone
MAGLLALGPSVNAQTNTAPPGSNNSASSTRHNGLMSVDNQLKQLTDQLHLTDAQKPKVKAALEERNKQAEGLRDLAPEDRRAKMRSIRTEMDSKMKEILTADQYQQFEKMRGRNRPPGAKPDAGAQ